MSAPDDQTRRFVVLDGMRGLAALVVITDHIASPLLMGLFPGRYLAVDFFFALSGFVLAHVYARRLVAGMSVGQFMRVRLIRLYPLYILAALAGAALSLISAFKGWGTGSLSEVASSTACAIMLAPCPPPLSAYPNAPFPFNGPSWSLFFELAVNLVFALIAARLTKRVLAGILVFSGLALIPVAFAFGKLDVGFAWSNFIGGFPRVTYAFFAGVLVYRMRAHWTAPAPPAWLVFALFLAVFMIPTPDAWRPVYELAATLILLPVLLAFAANAEARGALGAAAATMGALSYGIYVLQAPIMDWFALFWGALTPDDVVLPGAAHVAVIALLSMSAAAILNVIYDKPVRAWLSRRRQKPDPAATAET